MSLQVNHTSPGDPFRASASEIASLSELLGSIESDEWLLEHVGHALIRILSADVASLYLYDTSLSRVVAHAHVGLSSQEVDEITAVASTSPLAVPAERHVIETKLPLVRATAADFDRHPDPTMVSPTKTSDVVLPIVSSNRSLGVAYVWRRGSGHTYTTEQVDLAAACGRYAALGLLNDRQVVRLRALNQVGRQLSGSQDERSLYLVAFSAASDILSADVFSVAVLDPVRETIDFQFVHAAGQGEMGPFSTPFDEGPVSHVLRTGRSLMTQRAVELPSGAPEFERLTIRPQSSIHVPLRGADGVFGVISVQSFVPRAYSRDDVEILETIGLQTAIAIENTRSAQRERQRARGLTVVNRVSAAVNASLSLAATCEALDSELSTLIDAHAVSIFLHGDDGLNSSPAYRRDTWMSVGGEAISTLEAETMAALETGEPHVTRVTRLSDRIAGDDPSATTALIVPMRRSNEPTGVVVLLSNRYHSLDAEDRDLLRTVGTVAGLAIENARLFEAVEPERSTISRLADWQQALIAGARILTWGTDISRLIDGIADHLQRMLPQRVFGVYVVEDTNGTLSSLRVLHEGRPWPHHLSLSIGQGLIGAAVLQGQPILVNNAHLDPRSHNLPEGPIDLTRGESFIGAPLIVDGATMGAVTVGREGDQPFTNEEFEAFTAFVPHLAVALQTARLVSPLGVPRPSARGTEGNRARRTPARYWLDRCT